MSTKVTLKQRDRSKTHPGFHIYSDVLDTLDEGDNELQAPIYLRIDGVAVVLETLANGGAAVTIALPREVARALGLLFSVDCHRDSGQA